VLPVLTLLPTNLLTASFSKEKEPKEKEIDRSKGRMGGREEGRKEGWEGRM
jgi:hypothetical protein